MSLSAANPMNPTAAPAPAAATVPPAPCSAASAEALAASVFDMNTKAVVSLKAGRLAEGMEGLRNTLVHARTLLLNYQEETQALQQARAQLQAQLQAQQEPQAQAPQGQAQEEEGTPAPSNQRQGADAMDLEDNAEMQQQQQQQNLPLLSLFSVPLFGNSNHHEDRPNNNCPFSSQDSDHEDKMPIVPGDADAAHCPLFDRAFVLANDNPSSDMAWMEETHCQNVTLGTLLYNLALAHHLLALQKGDANNSRGDYQVSMNLYQMALSLLDNSIQNQHQAQQQPLVGSSCQNLLVLLCAIFNNMANIHSRHFHVPETRRCLECLKEVVDTYTNDPEQRRYAQGYSAVEEDHFFFYLNIYVTAPLHDFAIAPAA